MYKEKSGRKKMEKVGEYQDKPANKRNKFPGYWVILDCRSQYQLYLYCALEWSR